MVSFYPGPSKVYPQVKSFLKDAYDSGILSVNHRSSYFQELCQNTVTGLKNKLEIPDNYQVFFVSSATECWEIIAQSFIENESIHLFNGNFGRKWFEQTNKIIGGATEIKFSHEKSVAEYLNFVKSDVEFLAITPGETSNGTEIRNNDLKLIRKKFPNAIIACDVTSTMGGVLYDFSMADIWFASVQKCLGLPAGLGIMICSEGAIQKAKFLNKKKHYNDFLSILENMQNFQTTHTPNVLGIYLLSRSVEAIESISKISENIEKRAVEWYTFIQECASLTPLIQNTELRSRTVIAVKHTDVELVKKELLKEEFYIGNGYGDWKTTTFRIANFPQHTDEEIFQLKNLLSKLV